MKRFAVLLRKELAELITVQTLLPLAMVVVVFGGLGQMISAVGAERQKSVPVAVVDRDGGLLAEVAIEALSAQGLDPVRVTGEVSPESVRGLFDRAGARLLMEIPAGFSRALVTGTAQEIRIWSDVRSFSFVGDPGVTELPAALEAVNAAVAAAVAEQARSPVSPEVLLRPVRPVEHVVIGDRSAQVPVSAVMGFVAQQTTLVPVVLFVVIMFSAQMIATAVASEKENKTLETLLSFPVSRASIVLSKMIAAGLAALVGSGAYMLGMRQYMQGMEAGLTGGDGGAAGQASEATMRQLGLTLGPQEYAMLGLTLFAGILAALAMAVVLGAFADSARSAQAMLTPLVMLLLVPYMLSLFFDLSTLPVAVRTAVMAIPFTYVFLAGPSLFLGDTGLVWFGIAYEMAWFALFAAIAARMFESDRLLTMRLGWRRQRSG